MSQQGFCSEQLAPIKHGKHTINWGSGVVDVRFVKTENNCVFGSIIDIATPLCGEKCKSISVVVSQYLKKMKVNYGTNIKDAVSQRSENQHDGFKVSNKEGRIVYLNVNVLTKFVEDIKSGDAEKNRERMLGLLHGLKNAMDSAQMGKKRDQTEAVDAGEGGFRKRFSNIGYDVLFDNEGTMVPRNARGMQAMHDILAVRQKDNDILAQSNELKEKALGLKVREYDADDFKAQKELAFKRELMQLAKDEMDVAFEMERKKQALLDLEEKRVERELKIKRQAVMSATALKQEEANAGIAIQDKEAEATRRRKDAEANDAVRRMRAPDAEHKPGQIGHSCIDFDPNLHVTILSSFQKKRDTFKLIKNNAHRNGFLQNAGKLAKDAYIHKNGTLPTNYTLEGNAEVLVYLIEDTKMLEAALVTAYRKITSGGSQSTLKF